MLTSAGIGNHAVRPKNGRLFPLILIPDHVCRTEQELSFTCILSVNITSSLLYVLQLRFNPLTSDGAYDILKFIHDCPTSGIETLDLGVRVRFIKFTYYFGRVKRHTERNN